jgi:hypothetical protein
MEGNHVGDKNITTYFWTQSIFSTGWEIERTPGSNHVEVEHSSESAKESAPDLQGADPEEESDHKEENGDGFIIV